MDWSNNDGTKILAFDKFTDEDQIWLFSVKL